ncbi:MAG: F0F1 ATP synthase subunit B [Candidatus Moranbacteria bacterium]|nr:F0F1 ATP synthase subunit B [Candidatus Moranbacteria bacterium]
MDQLISTFHIDLKLLIAQVVNFLIVLLVLYKFAYGPVLKTLNARTKKIEKGISDADEARKKLEEVSVSEKEILTNAKKEAQEIIRKAEEAAGRDASGIVAEARTQTEKMMEQAKVQIEEEKEKILLEVKGEIAGLVMAATEKIIGEKMNKEKDEEIINKAMDGLK